MRGEKTLSHLYPTTGITIKNKLIKTGCPPDRGKSDDLTRGETGWRLHTGRRAQDAPMLWLAAVKAPVAAWIVGRRIAKLAHHGGFFLRLTGSGEDIQKLRDRLESPDDPENRPSGAAKIEGIDDMGLRRP